MKLPALKEKKDDDILKFERFTEGLSWGQAVHWSN